MEGDDVRHSSGWYDQSSWPYALNTGDQMLIRCEGGPGLSRVEYFPPRLELRQPGGTYALVDDGPPHEWTYRWMPDRP
jgi:hypothetical protein